MPGNTSGQTGAGSTAPSTQPPAFETALAASRRRASRQRAVFVLAVCAIGAGATMFRRMSRRRESIRAVGAAWDRYTRCLVGAPLAPGETARARLLQMELTLPEAAFSPRTLGQVQSVLRRIKAAALREGEDPEAPDFERTMENSESPALLGGAK